MSLGEIRASSTSGWSRGTRSRIGSPGVDDATQRAQLEIDHLAGHRRPDLGAVEPVARGLHLGTQPVDGRERFGETGRDLLRPAADQGGALRLRRDDQLARAGGVVDGRVALAVEIGAGALQGEQPRLAVQPLAQQVLDRGDLLVDQLDLPVDARQRPLVAGEVGPGLRDLAVAHGDLIGECLASGRQDWRARRPSGPAPAGPTRASATRSSANAGVAAPVCSAASRALRASMETNCARAPL